MNFAEGLETAIVLATSDSRSAMTRKSDHYGCSSSVANH
jgi:hypothetical protein